MKILLCHNYYRQPGGERRAVEQQTALLEAHGHEVVPLTRDSREIDAWGPLDKLRFPGTAVDSRRTYRQAVEIVRRHRPDVAHVHNVFPLLSPSLYRALGDAGVPVVQTVHNYRFLCPNGLFFTHGEVCERCKAGNTLHAVRLRCYRDSYAMSAIYAASIGLHRRRGTFGRIDRFLALTRFCADKLVEGGVCDAGRVRVLGNFVPGPLPPPAPPEEPPYALFLGRLTPEKGVDLLLEAMAGLPHRRLVVAGDGPAEAALRQRAAEPGLAHVRFAGFVAGEEKRRLLSRAWVSVVPSRWYEAFPFAVLESLAHGVPVVVSGHGSLASLVEDGRQGLRFEPGDAVHLRQRLETVLGDPALRRRLAAAGREWVEREHTEDVHYERLLRVYGELVQ